MVKYTRIVLSLLSFLLSIQINASDEHYESDQKIEALIKNMHDSSRQLEEFTQSAGKSQALMNTDVKNAYKQIEELTQTTSKTTIDLQRQILDLTDNINNAFKTSRARMDVMWHRVHYTMWYSDIYAAAALTWFMREAHIIQPFATHVSSVGALTLSVLIKTGFSDMVPIIATTGSLVSHIAAYSVPRIGSIAITTLAGKVMYDYYYKRSHHKPILELLGMNIGAFIRSCGKVAMAATIVGYMGSLNTSIVSS